MLSVLLALLVQHMAFFKNGEQCGEFNEPNETSDVVENKRGRFKQVALHKYAQSTY